MTINDILNKNALNMRHKDKFVIILRTSEKNFTLGENTFHSWIAGELDLTTYCYTCKCLEEKPYFIDCDNKVVFKLYKLYIDNIDLQREIYDMEDREYNRRLGNEKNPSKLQEV